MRLYLKALVLQLVLVVTMISCGDEATFSKCEYRISSSLPDSSMVRLFRYSSDASMEIVDSVYLFGSRAVIVRNIQQGETEFQVLTIGRSVVSLIAEPGVVNIDVDSKTATGTRLNDGKMLYDHKMDSIQRCAEHQFDSIAQLGSLSYDDRQAMLGELVNSVCRQSLALSRFWIRRNSDNALGQYVFWLGFAKNKNVDCDTYCSELNNVSEMVASFPPTRILSERIIRRSKTRVGCEVADIEAQDVLGEGSMLHLDVFVRKYPLSVIYVFDPKNDLVTIEDIKCLNNLRRFYGENLALLAISEDETSEIVSIIAEVVKPQWDLWSDTTLSFKRQYGIETLPCYFICDSSSTIRERGLSRDALRHWLHVELDSID